MPENDLTQLVDRIARLRREGREVEAGHALFEAVPPSRRPAWAAGVLRAVMDAVGVDLPEMGEVLAIAADPARWTDGHRAFSVLRRRAEYPGSREEYIVAIGELVAKVTYNATNPPDEFDEDSGWWIAKLAWELLRVHGGGATCSDRVEKALFSLVSTSPNPRP